MTVSRGSRRRVKWIVLTILVMGLLGYLGFRVAWREAVRIKGKRELASAIAEARRTDPDWTWERVNAGRPHPPPGQNAAELIPRIRAATHPGWGRRFPADDKPEWRARVEIPPNHRFSPNVIAEAWAALANSAEAVRLASTLKDRPTGRRDFDLPPNYHNLDTEDNNSARTVVQLLRWDVVVAIEDGDLLRATDGLLASLNASRSIGDEPLLLSQLVRWSARAGTIADIERALAQTNDAPGLSELQAALAADAEEPLLLYGFRGERAALDRLFENLYTGAATRDSFRPPFGSDSLRDRFAWWHYRGWLPGDRAFALAWMTRCVELAKLPVHEQIAPFRQLKRPGLEELKILSTMLLGPTINVAEGYWRTTAQARCAVAGIACERFRQKHGRWPDSLAELVPAFLPAVPLDPYTGEPLRYAKSETGAVVSSVGVQRPPEEFELLKINVTPRESPRFRLWNPDRRRLPPPPDPPEPPPDP